MASAPNLLEIPASIKCGRHGSCVPVVLVCLPQLVEGRNFVIEGWVSFGTTKEQRIWMVIDGKVFDPSLVQFRRFKNYAFGPTYMTRFKHTPVDFRRYWDEHKSSWWRARLASFGAPRTSWIFA